MTLIENQISVTNQITEIDMVTIEKEIIITEIEATIQNHHDQIEMTGEIIEMIGVKVGALMIQKEDSVSEIGKKRLLVLIVVIMKVILKHLILRLVKHPRERPGMNQKMK